MCKRLGCLNLTGCATQTERWDGGISEPLEAAAHDAPCRLRVPGRQYVGSEQPDERCYHEAAIGCML